MVRGVIKLIRKAACGVAGFLGKYVTAEDCKKLSSAVKRNAGILKKFTCRLIALICKYAKCDSCKPKPPKAPAPSILKWIITMWEYVAGRG